VATTFNIKVISATLLHTEENTPADHTTCRYKLRHLP